MNKQSRLESVRRKFWISVSVDKIITFYIFHEWECDMNSLFQVAQTSRARREISQNANAGRSFEVWSRDDENGMSE